MEEPSQDLIAGKQMNRAVRALTYEDEAGGLEELFIIPGGMLCLQQVTHTVVLTQPERGIQHEPRQQPKHFLAHGHPVLEWDTPWIVHQYGHLFH